MPQVIKNVINKIKLLTIKPLSVEGLGTFACECIDCHKLFFGNSHFDSKCDKCKNII
jgi:hypothetical protein